MEFVVFIYYNTIKRISQDERLYIEAMNKMYYILLLYKVVSIILANVCAWMFVHLKLCA